MRLRQKRGKTANDNPDKRKLRFIEKKCETKQKSIKKIESLMDARYAPRNKVSSKTKFWDDPCDRNDLDKIINLQELQLDFFFYEQ